MDIDNKTDESIDLKPKNRRSKHLLFGVVLMLCSLVLVAIAAYYYRASVNTQPTEVSDSQTENSYENLKTYTSYEYGFEMTIPREWTTEIDTDSNYLVFTRTPTSPDDPIGPSDMTLSIGDHAGIKGSESIQKTINGVDYIISDKCCITSLYEHYYEAYNDSKFYAFSAVSDEELEWVLSTFKFVEPISKWETYTNTRYNYSFKHPSDYSVVNTGPNPNPVTYSEDIVLSKDGPMIFTVEIRQPMTNNKLPEKMVNVWELPVKEYAHHIWQNNVDDISNPYIRNKQVSDIVEYELNNYPAYKFTVTESYQGDDVDGGYLVGEELTLVVTGKDKLKYQISFASHSVLSQAVLSTWKNLQ